MKWDNHTKEIIAYFMAFLSFGIGYGLTIAGFCVEPRGEVHGSVLAVLGEALAFAGSILGISMYIKSEFRTMKKHLSDSVNKKFLELTEDQLTREPASEPPPQNDN
ncbi:MAG: hypothetical protein J1F67_05145 [Muribaculaceae bacterium]|nr:hypothetical protein [Muribaculaceae bacterium]